MRNIILIVSHFSCTSNNYVFLKDNGLMDHSSATTILNQSSISGLSCTRQRGFLVLDSWQRFLNKARPGKERSARHVTRENTRQTKNIERELSFAARVNKNAFFCFQYLSFLGARRVIQQPRTLHWMLIRRKGNRLKTCEHH